MCDFFCFFCFFFFLPEPGLKIAVGFFSSWLIAACTGDASSVGSLDNVGSVGMCSGGGSSTSPKYVGVKFVDFDTTDVGDSGSWLKAGRGATEAVGASATEATEATGADEEDAPGWGIGRELWLIADAKLDD